MVKVAKCGAVHCLIELDGMGLMCLITLSVVIQGCCDVIMVVAITFVMISGLRLKKPQNFCLPLLAASRNSPKT
uniref:Uncharacterized protein n=1 Tax=Romanomermis culicivorax TaxID=13658 RepID=A0A915KB44_ROMCU